MLISSSDKKFSIILPNTNKALSEALKGASLKELNIISKGMDLNSLLESLFTQSPKGSASDKVLLELLKTNPTLKDLGSLSSTLKEILNSMKQENIKLPIQDKIKELLVDIKNLDNKLLKTNIKNSGVFLESKLVDAQNQKEIDSIISKDLKSLLLKTSQEVQNSSYPNKTELLAQMDKLSLQLDYYQLLSHLSDASSLYLPFSWDDLQEGQMQIKKAKDDKFYCDIELKLKEYGELNVRVVLYDKNQLNLQIHSDNGKFKELIQENISSLRSALIGLNITPREIRIMDMKKAQVKKSGYDDSFSTNLDMGFEVKV
jgi:hypothetical protein